MALSVYLLMFIALFCGLEVGIKGAMKEVMNEALSDWQKSHGFTYEQAAESLGLGRTMFWKYLKRPSLPRVIGLACQGVSIGQCVRNITVWHKRHRHTYVSGAAALGVSRATYASYLRSPDKVPRTVMLACGALDEGLEPLGQDGAVTRWSEVAEVRG
ncbi:hypothetical protein [Hydrogenophaga defluvii]|uniref:Uncharacterized protein n=1 Tax=Hydrogenophaga defluvii TaxID=249410 RepID=A0ABW2SGI0_9BURK